MRKHEFVAGEWFSRHRKTLGVAESCTGGLLAGRITDVPGASAYFLGGIIAYSNETKVTLLGVPAEVIATRGGVSAECAQAMAAGARTRFRSDFALAVTGIAGPSGGTPEKPVGLVYVALAAPDGAWVAEHRFPGSRQENRSSACEAALDLLLQRLRPR
ncbi:TPA: competence protein ComA [Candidatus Acetothermia bacterium]|nr:competence protein ComA [Candidatus Acetothermia bacterium]